MAPECDRLYPVARWRGDCFSDGGVSMRRLHLLLLAAGLSGTALAAADEGHTLPAESPAAAQLRHERVTARRKQTHVICHRGASEFAVENTLEAYRATLELGGDGNEIDIRATKD